MTDVVVVVFSILSLAAFVVIGLPRAQVFNLGVGGILQATGLLFFAYTGYSRIATLVEEVRDPKRTIPRATVVAWSTATLLYVYVAATAKDNGAQREWVRM